MLKQNHKEFKGFRNVGIRLSEEPTPNLIMHNTESMMTSLYAIHKFDKAHLVMLGEEELIPREDVVAMLRTLRATEQEGYEKARLAAGGGMHSAEYLLIRELTEEVGGRIHLGRSSGDLSAISSIMPIRDKLLEVMEASLTFRDIVIKCAVEQLETVMPGYTAGQSAQPITLGHQLASWAFTLERHFERAVQAFDRINMSPTGAAIMTGSNFAINRERTAELLGFHAPIENTFDAILNHDRFLEAFTVLALLNIDVARWADDLTLWSTAEFSFVEIPDRYCGTSSIMMQKKNPYTTGAIKGLGAASVGAMMTAFTVERAPTGIPMGERSYSSSALWDTFDGTIRNLNWFSDMLPDLEWKKDRMEDYAGRYWAQATDIAGALVSEKGMPWRTAHQIVGIVVRLGLERRIDPRDISTDLINEAAQLYMEEDVNLSEEALQRSLDPRNFVTARTITGGPAPTAVKSQLRVCAARIDSHRKEFDTRKQLVVDADTNLEAAIDALIGNA